MIFFKKSSNGFTHKMNQLKKIPPNEKQIIFYAENKASVNHLGPLIEEIVSKGIPIIFATSVKNTPIIFKENPLIKTIFVGKGISRINFFLTLETKILITDMPDLEKFHVKRSKKCDVHYVYVFHSIFSIHSYLRKGALDNFDTIFCVGLHHIREIHETEKIYNLKPKKLVQYGFPRLFDLKKNVVLVKTPKNLIIICPSYGINNFLIKYGKDLINLLLLNNYEVILRPHYRIFEDNKKVLDEILTTFSNHKNFNIERGILSHETLNNSFCMISDWSGISFEYAFAYFKPVIFVDVPMKNMNEEYEKISTPPIEIEMRKKIGYVLEPNNLENITKLLAIAKNNLNHKKNDIQNCLDGSIFNLNHAPQVGFEYIKNLLFDSK